METKRLTQSLVGLSRNILSFFLQNLNPDGTFQGDNKKSNKIVIDLCPAVVDSPFLKHPPQCKPVQEKATRVACGYNLRHREPPSTTADAQASSTKRTSQHDDEVVEDCTVVAEALNLISLEDPLPPESNHGSISTVSTNSLNVDSPPMSTCISLDYNTPTVTKNKKKNVRKAVKKKRSKGGMFVSPSSDNINPIINPKGIIRSGQKSYVKKHERKKDSYDSQLIETQVADTYYCPQKVLLNIHLARDVNSATSPPIPDNQRKMECFHQPHWNAIKSMDLTQFIG